MTEELDRYLSELSEIYSYDEFFKISISSVIDRLLEIRNIMLDNGFLVVDGDELAKYFSRAGVKKDEEK